MTRVAINGFGRIGRLLFRLMEDDPSFEVVAINDLTHPKDLAYLLRYDTSHRMYQTESLDSTDNSLIVDGKEIRVYAEKDPSLLPWKDLNIDIVFECTGRFTEEEEARGHIKAGAKTVIISAPGKGNMKTIVYNVNHEILTGEEEVISTASCTTNCLAPVLKLLDDNFKVIKGFMSTVHAYTNDQSVLDIPHPKGIESRRGRAAAANIVPTSTGAAKAIGSVLPNLDGRLNGIALRVPVIDGSVVDLTVELGTNVTKEQINELFINNSNETIKYTHDPIVSSDIIGSTVGALVDGLFTKVIEVEGSQLVKVIAWYDNEMGYSAQMLRTAKYFSNLMK